MMRSPAYDDVLGARIGPLPRWVPLASWIARRLPAGRYRFINDVCPRPAHLFWASLPETFGRAQFLCDLRDTMSREVCLTGVYEPQETAVLRTLLSPEMTFVDVGANWGYHTLLAAHLVGTNGRVLSLEPDPRLYERLVLNLERNRLSQVAPLQIAAADRPGTLQLLGYDPAEGNFGISQLATSEVDHERAFRVEGRDLDGLLEERGIQQIDVMKMDIEGAEVLALPGLRRMLETGRVHRLLLELHPAGLADRGTRPEAVLEGLVAHGYRAWSVDHSRATSRRVAYGRVARIDDLLQPAGPAALNSAWPHLLLRAPNLES